MCQETQISGLKCYGENLCLIISRWTKISLSWYREYKPAKRLNKELIQWPLPRDEHRVQLLAVEKEKIEILSVLRWVHVLCACCPLA